MEPARRLPLIVSAMAEALGVDSICVHLLDHAGGDGAAAAAALRRRSACGAPCWRPSRCLPVGAGGGPPGMAAATGRRWSSRTRRARSAVGAAAPARLGGPTELLVGAHRRHPGRARHDLGFRRHGGPARRPTSSSWSRSTPATPPPPSSASACSPMSTGATGCSRRSGACSTPWPARRRPRAAWRWPSLALCRGLGADAIALHHADGYSTPTFGPTELGPAAAEPAHRQAAGRGGRHPVLRRPARPGPPGRRDVLAVPIDRARRAGRGHGLVGRSPPPDQRRPRPARRRRPVVAAGARAGGARGGQRRGGVAAALAAAAARVPLPAQPRAAHPAHRHPGLRVDAAPDRRDLGQHLAATVPRFDRRSNRPAWAAWSATCWTSAPSTPGRCGSCPTGATSSLVLEAARRCVTEAPASLVRPGRRRGLPPIWGDHDRLEQVFVNLFDNAARHAHRTHPGQRARPAPRRRPTPSPCASPTTARAYRRTWPSGSSCPTSGETTDAGAGLGLAIARGIVDAHGGIDAPRAGHR